MEAKAAAKEVDEIDALNASLEAVDAKVKLVSGNAQQANAPTPPPSESAQWHWRAGALFYSMHKC